MGMDGLGSVTMMGTNALIRRSALLSIGGYQPGLAEDLATSVALHAAGWRSAYVPEPLAPGLAPPDVAAWFTQQLKWARGVFEMLLTVYPRVFKRLTWGQRLSYAIRMTNYWAGPFVCVHLLSTVAVLISGSSVAQADFQQYLLHLFPVTLINVLIHQIAMSLWRHPSTPTTSLWRAVSLVYFTWPVYTLAWVMAVLRVPLAFRPTPKTARGNLNPQWVLPQTVTLLLLAWGMWASFASGKADQLWVLLGFAGLQGGLLLLVLCQRLRPHRLKGLLAQARSGQRVGPVAERCRGDVD
jgi:cellulose synthase/poly-beta-1,6-N-acetylglucosamine synthase-like glycosyltransferase